MEERREREEAREKERLLLKILGGVLVKNKVLRPYIEQFFFLEMSAVLLLIVYPWFLSVIIIIYTLIAENEEFCGRLSTGYKLNVGTRL